MRLEVCANSYESALNAQKAGAQRIELCERLDLGGVTPATHIFKKVRSALAIPIFVLVRPRAGDFCYTSAEFKQMCNVIDYFKSQGCDGIVSGILNSDQTIDISRTKALIAVTRPLPFTFHRAFDETKNPMEAFQQLSELGVDRILTSGQQQCAIDGLELLQKLKASQAFPQLLPGAGITPAHAAIFKTCGFEEIHASCSETIIVSGKKTTQSSYHKIVEVLQAMRE